MSATLRFQLAWRALRATPGLSLLNVLGVAIGVAVVLAVQLANHSTLGAFQATLDSVAGKANLEVTADGSRFDERAFASVRRAPGVAHAAPIVEAVLLTPNSPVRYLRIIGMDLFEHRPFLTFDFSAHGRDLGSSLSETQRSAPSTQRLQDWLTDPSGIAISAQLGKKFDLQPGSRVTVLVNGERKTLTVRDWITFDGDHAQADEHLAVMDIAAAQELFGAVGKLDRIDIITRSDPFALAALLNSSEIETGKYQQSAIGNRPSLSLPPNAFARMPERRGAQIASMLGAFQLNLSALSLISLIVAGFLLHATMTTLVVRQRRTLGILRAIGCSPGQVQNLVFLQAIIIGAAGLILGSVMGYLLARWSLDSMSQTISSLYLLVHIEKVMVEPWVVGAIWTLGFAVTLTAAWRPAREAARLPPIETIASSRSSFCVPCSAFVFVPWLLIASSLFLAWAALNSTFHWLGFGSALAWILALAVWTPSWTRRILGCGLWIQRGLCALASWRGLSAPRSSSLSSNNEEFLNSQPLVPNSLHSSGITELALRNLTGSLHRSAIAVAAVMMAFSMMLGASVMIDSFRSTVNYWINQSVKADVYLTPASNLIHGGSEALSDSVAHEIPQIKGVSDYDTYHEAWLDFSDTPAPSPQSSVLSPPSPDPHTVKLAAIDFRVMQRHPHLTFKGRRFTDFLKLCKENRVLVNESFATRFGKNTGDSISLRTPSGKTEFRIEGIFYDYSTDSGRVLMDQSRYSILWKDQRTYSYALYLDGSRPAHDVKREIEQRFGKEARLAIFLNQELRSEVLRVFDQTFAITLSLRAITVAVAALTLFLTLTTLIAERERELGILRSLGVQSTTLLRMVMTEAFALGVVGWFMGCVGGLGISWLLAFVINKAYFGWTIQWRLDPSLFVAAFFLAMPAALFAGFFSGLRAIKTPIHEALRYE